MFFCWVLGGCFGGVGVLFVGCGWGVGFVVFGGYVLRCVCFGGVMVWLCCFLFLAFFGFCCCSGIFCVVCYVFCFCVCGGWYFGCWLVDVVLFVLCGFCLFVG